MSTIRLKSNTKTSLMGRKAKKKIYIYYLNNDLLLQRFFVFFGTKKKKKNHFFIKLQFRSSRPGFSDCNLKRLALEKFACLNAPPKAVSKDLKYKFLILIHRLSQIMDNNL